MRPVAARALPALLLALSALAPLRSAFKPLRPRNVKLRPVERGLLLTWDPPNELDGRPVDRYSIGYGKSMSSLHFITVDKDQRSEVLEDVEPGVPHILKMIAENEEGMSTPVYRTVIPGEEEWVKLDGFAVEGRSPNGSSPGRRSTEFSSNVNPRLTEHRPAIQQRPPQSSSGPEAPRRVGYLPIRPQNKHRVDLSQPQADQRKPKFASESVFVVSLNGNKAPQRSALANKAHINEAPPPEPEVVEEAEDITVRVISPQSVLITWVDPLVQKRKSIPEGSRHYTVRYREKGESARWEYKETTQRRLMIEKLFADGMYEFSVRITQGDQHGKWSVSVFQRTPESVPSGPPENFEVKPLRGKGTAITATWDAPDEPNGKIREYILSYAPALKPFGSKSVTYRGTVTSANIDGLTPGDRYIFKIRAVNRKGQGPQSKALSVVMPGTSTDLGHSSQSKNPSRASTNEDSEHEDIEETEESIIETTTSPPLVKKHRPLSQTRSYHSIISAVRGTMRKSNSRTSINSNKEDDDEVTVNTNQYETKENEAAEDTQPENTNNVLSKTGEEDDIKDLPGAKESSPVLKTSVGTESASQKSSSDSQSKTTEEHQQVQSPRTSPLINRFRQPHRSSGSRSRNPSRTSLISSRSHEPDATKTILSSSNPEGKSSPKEEKLNTPSPQVAKKETDIEGSLSSASLPSSRASNVPAQASRLGSGSVYLNGKRVIPARGHKPRLVSSSSTLSQSTTPAATVPPDNSDSHTTSNQNTNIYYKNDHAMSKDNESPHSSYHFTTTHPPLIQKNTQETENNNYKDSYASQSHLSRTNPSQIEHGSPIANRNSRIVMSSRRKDGRMPWSRTASSVGAERPHFRGSSSRPTTYTSKHVVHPTSAKPTVNSVQSVPTNGPRISIDNSENRHLKPSNDHDKDYLDEVSKETYETNNKDAVPTSSTKPIASEVKEPQHSGNTPASGSQSASTASQRPGFGSNGKSRSSILASRLQELRLRSKLQSVQTSQLGFPAKQDIASSSVLPHKSPVDSQQQQTLTSNQDTGTNRIGNGRLIVGSDSRSALRHPSTAQHPSGETSTDVKTSSTSARNPVVGSRLRNPIAGSTVSRGKTPISLQKSSYGQGKNGRPNLTDQNKKMPSTTTNENTKTSGLKHITGPDGSKWVVDLDKGVLMNEDGKVLQDSRGRPKKIILGEDGKTIFDEQGSPLVNQEGMALFGHGRDTRPVVNPKDKYLTLGGKPVVGLNRPTTSTTTTTTTTATTTTTTTTTTTPEPTTTEMTTLEPITDAPPTCPPGTFARLDNNGVPMMDDSGILDCFPDDDFFIETTMHSTTTLLPIFTPAPAPGLRQLNNTPSSEYDATGKKRFTAPYVNYIQKDPGAPCSLTEALDYLQVDVLADLIEKDSMLENQKQPPKNKPHNITVIAMEGCHSFVILDWARPLKDDMVSGYMVHSASYDDILNDRWSSRLSSGTHLAVENLKPNSRYYFRVQAKNIHGLGPVSDTLTYITESDDPLLIERPPGGEPIWIPYTFRYNHAHSSCKGSQFVKRTWYRKFVGVVLCNSLRYKIFMGDGLKETFYSVADSYGHGEDHCQFVDSHLEGRTGPHGLSLYLPPAQGYYRSFRQEPVIFGPIGRRTAHHFVGWYECGVPIPGKW